MSIRFTMRGRIGRRTYFTSSLVVVLLTYASVLSLGFSAGVSGNDALSAMALVVAVVGCVLQSALVVRRLHDMGRPGWHYWTTLIPIYSIYIGLLLLFTEGTGGDNPYGPPSAA